MLYALLIIMVHIEKAVTVVVTNIDHFLRVDTGTGRHGPGTTLLVGQEVVITLLSGAPYLVRVLAAADAAFKLNKSRHVLCSPPP